MVAAYIVNVTNVVDWWYTVWLLTNRNWNNNITVSNTITTIYATTITNLRWRCLHALRPGQLAPPGEPGHNCGWVTNRCLTFQRYHLSCFRMLVSADNYFGGSNCKNSLENNQKRHSKYCIVHTYLRPIYTRRFPLWDPARYRTCPISALVQSAHFYLFLHDTRVVPRPIPSGAICLRHTSRQTCPCPISAFVLIVGTPLTSRPM